MPPEAHGATICFASARGSKFVDAPPTATAPVARTSLPPLCVGKPALDPTEFRVHHLVAQRPAPIHKSSWAERRTRTARGMGSKVVLSQDGSGTEGRSQCGRDMKREAGGKEQGCRRGAGKGRERGEAVAWEKGGGREKGAGGRMGGEGEGMGGRGPCGSAPKPMDRSA